MAITERIQGYTDKRFGKGKATSIQQQYGELLHTAAAYRNCTSHLKKTREFQNLQIIVSLVLNSDIQKSGKSDSSNILLI